MEQTSLLSKSVWLALPKDTRTKLAALFEFPPIGNIQTMYGPTGPLVLSDGYEYDAFQRVTLQKMNELLGTHSDNFYATFKNLVKHLDDIIGGEKIVIEEVVVVEATLEEAREALKDAVGIIGDAIEEKPRFCQYCESRGVRHKKDCTRPTKEHETKTA